MDLSVGRFYGCRQRLHAVDALSGIAQAGVEHRFTPRPGTIHIGILRRLCAALSCNGDEGFGGGPGRNRWRSLLVGGDT